VEGGILASTIVGPGKKHLPMEQLELLLLRRTVAEELVSTMAYSSHVAAANTAMEAGGSKKGANTRLLTHINKDSEASHNFLSSVEFENGMLGWKQTLSSSGKQPAGSWRQEYDTLLQAFQLCSML